MLFTPEEEKILNRVQKDIFLSSTPFKPVAAELGIPEDTLLRTLSHLRESRVIRNISAVLNAASLGYSTSLVAFCVPEDYILHARDLINAHPGVSHNYLRDHKYNIWFTLSVPGDTSLSRTVSVLASKCSASDFLILKNEKTFKIGLDLHIGEGDDNGGEGGEPAPEPGTIRPANEVALSAEDKTAISLLQSDLPLVPRPFKAIIEAKGMSIGEDWLAARGQELKDRGIIRRYSAVLKHHDAGYKANAMTAWKTGVKGNEEGIIKVFLSCRNISHLYSRTVYPGRWEYPLFAMIHEKSENALEKIIKGLEEKSGITDYLVLRSLQEFKKQRVRYFSPEFEEWNRVNL